MYVNVKMCLRRDRILLFGITRLVVHPIAPRGPEVPSTWSRLGRCKFQNKVSTNVMTTALEPRPFSLARPWRIQALQNNYAIKVGASRLTRRRLMVRDRELQTLKCARQGVASEIGIGSNDLR